MKSPLNESSSHPSVVIIGGGVSGCLVAAHLMRQAKSRLDLTLVERAYAPGRGVAYGTEVPEHLLNSCCGRMSAYREDPEHFARWLASRSGRLGFPSQIAPWDYVRRSLYGRYIEDVLRRAAEGACAGVRLNIVRADAVDLEELPGGGGRVHLNDGRHLCGNQVVLAIGNLPGEYPIRRSLRVYQSERYVHVPWLVDWTGRLGEEDPVLLVGAGLTSVDIVLQLRWLGHHGKIIALSRRGYRPAIHRSGKDWHPFLAKAAASPTLRALVRSFRNEVEEAAKQGVDWRAVFDAARPEVSLVWQKLSWADRARFLRHVRPIWDAHRHRIAPQVGERLRVLEEDGTLTYLAGRLLALDEVPGGVQAIVQERRTGVQRELSAAIVVNCTGPRSDYSKFQHPLLINALGRGLIDHDPLALGLHASPEGRVHRYRSGPSTWLWTLGTPLKGMLWECTGVPEIRSQAEQISKLILDSHAEPW